MKFHKMCNALLALMTTMSTSVQQLTAIRFEPHSIYLSTLIEDLKYRPVHITLDQRLQEHSAYFDEAFFATNKSSKCTWSLAVQDGKVCGESLSDALPAMQVRSLQWSHPLGVKDETHLKILAALEQSPCLEELQISEKAFDMQDEMLSESYAPQICSLITSLPSLKRLSIEGSHLTTEILPILRHFQTLQDLRIYMIGGSHIRLVRDRFDRLC